MSGSPAKAAGVTGTTRTISKSGTGTFSGTTSTPAGGVQRFEISKAADGAVGPNRSDSTGDKVPVGPTVQPKNVTATTPGLQTSFDGLNHFDQRWGSTAGGNQFSLEPPDQGLCVGQDGSGNTRVLEVLNDVARVYDTSGNGITPPTALNPFFGYAPAIVRSPAPPTFGPFVTDPSCLYDAQTGHWFIDVLTLDTFPHPGSDGFQHFTGTNHLDLAVSNTSDPTGSWTIYRIPVQDDGTDGTPNHGCQANTNTATPLPTNPNACLGDYPHLGSDANGIYLTTNEYSLFGNNFIGAQVYALSKAQLEGGGSVAVTQFNTHGLDTFGFALNGFTLWPSTTPGGGGDPSAGGTEYFLSSNAAAEAHDTGDGLSTTHPSKQLLVWAITNTSSLDSTPALTLSNTEVDVGTYALPPQSSQKNGTQPQRDCYNSSSCSINFLLGFKDPFPEPAGVLDSNDTRMQQVTWVNGQLWGALDTALSVSSAKQAGIEWFDVAPSTSTGSVTASLTNSGYMGLGNDNLIYPAIGMTSGGTGVMAFTLVGNDYYPSAGYARVDGNGVGSIHIAAPGVGPDDGFTLYRINGPVTPGVARPRWGDYGAAVPWGDNVWIGSEYIGQSCTFSQYLATAGLCGDTRSALANWGTRISEVAAP